MKPLTIHTGLVLPMDRSNVDTDQIIPKQFLKRIERTGFGQFLFYDWRYLDEGRTPDPTFELNRPEYAGVSVLLARRNFGSGSSREHAPWAIEDHGFRVLIAPSFADIFYNNCFRAGLLPLKYDEATIDELFARAAAHPRWRVTVDLESNRITDEFGLVLPIEIDPFRRECLLHGWDDIGLTLRHEADIAAYEATHAV